MNLQHIAFKIFVDGTLTADWEQFINVFHRWVADQSMPEMMIDVADYRHVPNGPGVVMVGHAADYYMDNTAGRPGLRYVCKSERGGSNIDRVQQAFAAVASACARMEAEIPGLKFSRTDFEITINDRAIAPNNDTTREHLSSALPEILEQVFGFGDNVVECQKDPRKLAGAAIKVSVPIELVAG